MTINESPTLSASPKTHVYLRVKLYEGVMKILYAEEHLVLTASVDYKS